MNTQVQGGKEPRKAIIIPGVVAVIVLTAFFGLLGASGLERRSTRALASFYLVAALGLTAAFVWGAVVSSRRGASRLQVADAALGAWMRVFVLVLIGFVTYSVIRDL